MRSYLYLCFGLALSAVSWASPPVSGGFMTGADSAVIVFWFHPEVHAYEQGIDGEFEESILSAGDVPGQYSMAQKAAFPFMSFIETYLIKIYGGDIVPSLPGDQFSPFGYSIYRNGDNGLPEAAPIRSGVNRATWNGRKSKSTASTRVGKIGGLVSIGPTARRRRPR